MNFDRSKIPQAKSEVKFTSPEIKNLSLSNRLKILFVQKDFLPMVKLKLIANCGSIFDPADKRGLANLFSLMIDEGAGNYDALELSEEFDMLGSSFSVSCNHDNVHLSLNSLTEHFERSLELLSLIILQPHFNDHDLQREKRKVEVKLLQRKVNPEELSNQAFEFLVNGILSPYAYSVLGFQETISRINTIDIKEFHSKNFNPQSSALIVVGNIAEDKLIELLEKYIGSWENRIQAELPQIKMIKNKPTVYIMHKEGSVQTEIRVGHLSSKRNTPDYFAKTLMNLILGGQFSSRINLNLREAKGFTYGSTSNFFYSKHAGEFCLSTSVATENTRSAVDEIIFEFERMKKGASPEEINFAKSSLVKKFPLQFESYGSITLNLTLLAIHDLPIDYFKSYLNQILNCSPNEINQAAVDNIKLDELSIVLVGNKENLLQDFESFNYGGIKLINERGEIIS